MAILDEPLETMDRAIREDILVWVDHILASGAAVVVATHQIEPSVGKAVRAIAFRDGGWRLVEALPEILCSECPFSSVSVVHRIKGLDAPSRELRDLATARHRFVACGHEGLVRRLGSWWVESLS